MDDTTKPLSKVIWIDESEIRGHLDELVRGTVEETLNAMLDTEANEMCNAQRYEHSPDRVDTRAGSYKRKLLPVIQWYDDGAYCSGTGQCDIQYAESDGDVEKQAWWISKTAPVTHRRRQWSRWWVQGSFV